jgi:Arc/MetJ family transcription regulator
MLAGELSTVRKRDIRLTTIEISRLEGPDVAKTSIDIDDRWLELAAEFLGTKTKKDTVNAALERIGRMAAMERMIQHAREGLYDDLRDPEVMKGAWR